MLKILYLNSTTCLLSGVWSRVSHASSNEFFFLVVSRSRRCSGVNFLQPHSFQRSDSKLQQVTPCLTRLDFAVQAPDSEIQLSLHGCHCKHPKWMRVDDRQYSDGISTC